MTDTVKFISFDANGKILKSGLCKISDVALQGTNTIQGAGNDAENYIENPLTTPTIAIKPANPTTANKTTITADGVDSVIFSSIPVGTIVTFETPAGADLIPDTQVDDGTLVLTCTFVGDYILTFEFFPYLTYTETIVAS